MDAGLPQRTLGRAMLLTSLPRPFLIGVVHLAATPGSPRFSGALGPLLEAAVRDAEALTEGGCHALIVENFGDVPFHPTVVPAETVATLALALECVGGVTDLPVGVNVLRNDARAALGLCATGLASFLRVNVHTGQMVTDQGPVCGRAAETLRERGRLCPEATLLADVHVKHATPPAGERLEDAARDAALRGLADALVVSGAATGAAPDPERVERVRAAVPGVPLLIGSGLSSTNAQALLAHADGAIVGTAVKEEGRVERPVDPARVRALLGAIG